MSNFATEYSTKSQHNSQSDANHIMIGSHCTLTLADIKSFTHTNSNVQLSQESNTGIDQAYQFLKSCVEQRIPIYGVNTNFGDQVTLTDRYLKDGDATQYDQSIIRRQENIIKSLACGLGDIISPTIVRTTMLLRAHCISQGYSGVSHHAIQSIIGFLNAGITPVVRRYGSIGASGDLIPLSMIAAALLGENVDVHYQNKIMKSSEAIALAGISPFKPQLRDGLALINGTSFMTAITSISLYQLKRLYKQMLAAIAMSLESMLVITSAYHPLIHQVKRQTGECTVSEFFNAFWKDSQLVSDLDELRAKTSSQRSVQDYYSLRAIPQGFGPFQENLETATRWVENEMNSVNDNPIVDLKENTIHHGANFMGYYITDTCDMLKTDIAQASTWIHALLANMVHPRKNHQLPANIVPNPDQNNGFRSIQLLSAALAVQNRKLAQSQQAFMLPTEGDNQDVNSLGTHAALDFQEAVTNLERLTALLFLASTQALELRGIEKASSNAQAIYRLVREYSPTVLECRPMTDEIYSVITLLSDERI
jgi:histidine ammonia-lyase